VARAASASATRASSLRSACLGCRCAAALATAACNARPAAAGRHRTERERPFKQRYVFSPQPFIVCPMKLGSSNFALKYLSCLLKYCRPTGHIPRCRSQITIIDGTRERERDYWQKGDSFARGGAHALFALCSRSPRRGYCLRLPSS
jgi:hypothetical protein